MTTETGGALTVWRRTIALVYPVAPRLVVGLAAWKRRSAGNQVFHS